MQSTPQDAEPKLERQRNQNFSTTRWSVVMAAGSQGDTLAMEELITSYWYPLYAFVRRSGQSVHDAQDLTQSFLAYVLEHEVLAKADKNRGRFRSFLLGTMKNYLANERRMTNSQKRGGHHAVVPFEGEDRYQIEAVDSITPTEQFDRSWALALLERVLVRLRGEFEKTGRLELFKLVEPRLTGAPHKESLAAVAEQIGISENTVAVTLHRLRQRYGELLRQEISETIVDPTEVEDEIRHLMKAVATQ